MVRIVPGVVAALVVLVIGVVMLAFPRARPPADLHVPSTPAQIERGRYLAENVADCFSCHSPRDFGKYSGPPRADRFGAGNVFDRALGFPGDVAAPNITPASLSTHSDGEIVRALREGVAKDGHAIFGFMPYTNYRALSDDDAQAIVAYLRTLKPIANDVPKTKIDFPVNVFVRLAPAPLNASVRAPDRSDRVAYGAYLATVAGCKECHSPHDAQGAVVEARAFGGGFPIQGPWGVRTSANISPSTQTFVGTVTRDQFVARFAAFRGPPADIAPAANTPMPWAQLAGMTDDDLGALYDYLRTQRPIDAAPAAAGASST